MKLEQLMSRYYRLKQELDIAYRTTPWVGHRIDRLANELTALERSISKRRDSNSWVS